MGDSHPRQTQYIASSFVQEGAKQGNFSSTLKFLSLSGTSAPLYTTVHSGSVRIPPVASLSGGVAAVSETKTLFLTVTYLPTPLRSSPAKCMVVLPQCQLQRLVVWPRSLRQKPFF